MLKKIKRIVFIVLLFLCGSLLIWGAQPNHHQKVTQFIQPSEMTLPQSGEANVMAVDVARQVVLDWPAIMRIGEKEVITLTFEPIQAATPSTDTLAGYSNVYNRYNLMVEARFEVAGITVNPANPIRESMPSGHTVKFKWEISSGQTGVQQGTIWLSLRFLPLDGSQAIQIPIYVNKLNIVTTSLFGLSRTNTAIIGGVGILVAVLIVIDDMIAIIKRWLSRNSNKDLSNPKDAV